MTTAPSPKALSLAMSMIDRRSWRVPAQVVDLVRACTVDDPTFPRDELVLLARDQVSDWFRGDGGDSRKHVRDVMVRLADEDRVLRRVAGAGRRPDAWGLNTLREWRNVPWSVPRELALLRVELACAGPIAPQGSASGAIHSAPLPGVEARFIPRLYGGVVGRSQVPGPRHNDLPRGAVWTAPQRSDGDGGHCSSERESSLYGEGGRESTDRILEAITAKTGRRVWGQLVQDVAELAAAFDLEVVLAAVAGGPPELQPPKLVQWVNDELRRSAPAPKGPDWYRARAANVRAQLELLDDDDPERQILVDELAECETGAR